MREIPNGYGWPGPSADHSGWIYWLTPQADWHGATPQFMVIKDGHGEQHILAQKCYLQDGVEIVDALRATQMVRT